MFASDNSDIIMWRKWWQVNITQHFQKDYVSCNKKALPHLNLSFIHKTGHLLSECSKTSRPDYKLEDIANSQMLKQCWLLYHHLHLTSDLLPVITGEWNQLKHSRTRVKSCTPVQMVRYPEDVRVVVFVPAADVVSCSVHTTDVFWYLAWTDSTVCITTLAAGSSSVVLLNFIYQLYIKMQKLNKNTTVRTCCHLCERAWASRVPFKIVKSSTFTKSINNCKNYSHSLTHVRMWKKD
jgi:hypothetical protein